MCRMHKNLRHNLYNIYLMFTKYAGYLQFVLKIVQSI